ncbi:hypothetical protein E4U30_004955 [Claviceps sp. LM220 group G6]|nr:hypothetical protein E4U15_006157 [Claviceps sp. LM218 group G6]KAG6092781.1 hypothetical protein E4U30_004955 [Claviceps sp. LM220 group G6]KAG6108568.1 hypothetical protein E4U14_003579 [Claviceps sp. LM454 group G7]
MDTFTPIHEPDEGYSEDPLNPPVHQSLAISLAALRSPADLQLWLASNALALPLSVKKELTLTLLDNLPTSVIAEIVQRLNPRLYIDFVQYLPAEICLKVLGYLDPVSLVCVARTCRQWYELALDRKLWERLYYLEGWKAIASEIDLAEAQINAGLRRSIGRSDRTATCDGQATRTNATKADDEDVQMTDVGRQSSPQDGAVLGMGSLFASPRPSSRHAALARSLGNDITMDMRFMSSSSIAKGKSVDRSFASPDVVRVKRKEPGGTPEPSWPPSLPTTSSNHTVKSTLWAWDVNNTQYRINWKYLYNMRRRLESNWELGKYTTFQLPHPNYPEEGHQECVYTLQFDAHYLVSGSRDQSMRIWNIRTQRLARPPLVGHSGSVLCLQFDASPEEDLIVSGSSDSNVFVWKFSTGELVQSITNAHRESVLNVRFDKRILVTSSKDKTIKIFNRRPLRFGELGYNMGDGAFDPAAKTVKRYGYEPDLALELPIKEPYSMIGRLEGHGAAVNAIQVLGRTIVSVSGDRHIKVWDWPDQVCTQTIPAHDKGIACVEFDGRRIVSGSSDYEVCIFDAPTGLKVAQLRGHAHLVRTVQAGFGDLPCSRLEDEADAKAVDTEYFKAVEAGEVSHDGERRNRRLRRANAGSSRPVDVQAFGAKVPPGGGGGRKYGRIVSGSYDQSIIIWRRDKEGVWKPAHHLRQEEAAAAAQRNTAPSAPHPQAHPQSQQFMPQLFPGQSQASLPRHPPGTQPIASSSQSRDQPLETTIPVGPIVADPDGRSSASVATWTNLIDRVVQAGPQTLERALASFPVLLSHHGYLQSAIEMKESPVERAELRQVVIASLVSSQAGQAQSQAQASRSHTPASSSAVLSEAASPSSQSSNNPLGHRPLGHTPGETSLPLSSLAGPSTSSAPAGPSAYMTSSNTNPHQTSFSAPAPAPASLSVPLPGPAPASAQPALLPLMHAAAAAGAGAAATPITPHHPHIVSENPPARVFKLQFDARKIVCCSQAPVIVGWDFCNGDGELEETASFFATVD